MDGISASGETVTAATALAGLILVYLGTLANGFSTFQPAEKKTVREKYKRRASFACIGIIFGLVSAALGVLGKWLPNENCADLSIVFLLVTFGWCVVVAILTSKEIA